MLSIDYDSESTELLEAKPTELLPGSMVTSQYLSVRPYMLQWLNAENMLSEGEVAVVRFRARKALGPEEWPFRLEVADAFNQDEQRVALNLSGQCGDDLFYTLNNGGTLTVTGSGPMWDFSGSSPAP